MKKLFSILLTAVMATSIFTGCSNSNNSAETNTISTDGSTSMER